MYVCMYVCMGSLLRLGMQLTIQAKAASCHHRDEK